MKPQYFAWLFVIFLFINGGTNTYAQEATFTEIMDAIRYALDGNVSQEDVKSYATLLKGTDKKTMQKLRKLRDARRYIRKDITLIHLETWLYLLARGAKAEEIARIDEIDIDRIVSSLKSGFLPKDFIKKFSINPLVYSIRAAERDRQFPQNAAWVRAYIKNRLAKYEHMYRLHTDYSEEADEIDKIKDVHLLFLVKKLVDFFETPAAIKRIASLFSAPIETDVERGGLIFANGTTVKLTEVMNEETVAPKSYYLMSPAHYYMDVLGGFHTHPLDTADNEPQPRKFSGPSGSPTESFVPCSSDTGDTAYLKCHQYKAGNPYLVEVIISRTSEKSWNVDILLQDVVTGPAGEKKSSDDYQRVIDLGIFSTKFSIK